MWLYNEKRYNSVEEKLMVSGSWYTSACMAPQEMSLLMQKELSKKLSRDEFMIYFYLRHVDVSVILWRNTC
jgi:hypothetical protein